MPTLVERARELKPSSLLRRISSSGHQPTTALEAAPLMEANKESVFYKQTKAFLLNYLGKRPYVVLEPQVIQNEGPVSKNELLSSEVEVLSGNATEIITRNNDICITLHGSEGQPSPYKDIRAEKNDIKGPTELLLEFCVDGRIKRILFGLVVNTWEVPAGENVCHKREDGTLIPASPELRGALTSFAEEGKEILEIFLAHYDSKVREHGCAAMNLIQQSLRLATMSLDEYAMRYETADEAGKQQFEELLKAGQQRLSILGPENVQEILNAPNPELANVKLLKMKNVKAFTTFFNEEVERVNKQKERDKQVRIQDIVGIVALYDTSTKGVIFNPDKDTEKQFSTTQTTTQFHRGLFYAAGHIASWGKYAGEEAIHPKNLVDFARDQKDITKVILDPNSVIPENLNDTQQQQLVGRERWNARLERFGLKVPRVISKFKRDSQPRNELLAKIDSYIDKNFTEEHEDGNVVDLTSTQKQALRFYMAKTIALQYLKGLTGADHHNEGYMAVALGGEIAGKYDLEQMFGSNPADLKTLVEQVELELKVMRLNRPDIKRPFVFATSSINRKTYEQRHGSGLKEYNKQRANNLTVWGAIAGDEALSQEVIPIGVLIDEQTREILEVFDHSTSVAVAA